MTVRLRWSLAIALLLASPSACQIAKSKQPEVRLPAVKTALPIAPVESYEVDAAELAPAALRQEPDKPFDGLTTFELPPSTLTAARAYRLVFRAKNGAPRPATVAVKFREPTKNNSFRTYSVTVSEPAWRDYTLELTAPAYATRAEVVIDARSAQLSLAAVSLKMRGPVSRTEPVTSWSGSFVPEGYALVFNDEFSGSALNRSKWFTRYIYSSETLDRLNDENQHYTDDDTQRVSGGVLKLVAKRNKLSRPSGVNYESGMIRSDFTLRYGFLEARVKMPGGLGVWPAFWINSDVSETGQLSHPPEIDFFEFVNNGKDDKINEIHSAGTKDPTATTKYSYEHPSFWKSVQKYRAPFNFNDGFHTIGAEWTKDEYSVYVDGLKIYARN
ncbi:MAG TPA: glycoside hydrolase family 16 protein, partial [Polyangiaceae bacterium]|nr:glycoside hydrolase family 16 protein [Polyangiaceae bacterium]